MPRKTTGDIDTIRSAIRPRLAKLQAGIGSPPPATLKPHTHSADQITFEPYGHIEADRVQAAIQELDDEKLARDGSQTMLGALDMNHFDVINIEDAEIELDLTVGRNIMMTGVTEAMIVGPRKILMSGEDDDGAGLIEFLERIIFNDAPGVIKNPRRIEFNITAPVGSALEGLVEWGGGDDAPVTNGEGNLAGYAASGSGVVPVLLGWDVLYCVCGLGAISKGQVVRGQFTESSEAVEQDNGHPVVELFTGATEIPARTNQTAFVGVAMSDAAPGEPLQVMRRGMMRDVSFVGDGPILWAGALGDITGTRPTAPATLVRIGTPTDGASSIVVDVEVIPPITELTGVLVQDPQDRDVMVFDAAAGVYEPRRLYPVRTDTGAAVTIGQKDYRVICGNAGDVTATLPDPAVSNGHRVVVSHRMFGDFTLTITTTGNTIEEGLDVISKRYGEDVAFVCDGSVWWYD